MSRFQYNFTYKDRRHAESGPWATMCQPCFSVKWQLFYIRIPNPAWICLVVNAKLETYREKESGKYRPTWGMLTVQNHQAMFTNHLQLSWVTPIIREKEKNQQLMNAIKIYLWCIDRHYSWLYSPGGLVNVKQRTCVW